MRRRPHRRAPHPWVPLPIPDAAQRVLARIPADFVDDGCSVSPDKVFGTQLSWKWACRIHDMRYCTRANPRGVMGEAHRAWADGELRRNIASTIPWAWGPLIPWIYWRGVRRFGNCGAYDTCGPFAPLGVSSAQQDEGRCRHGLLTPPWMLQLAHGERAHGEHGSSDV